MNAMAPDAAPVIALVAVYVAHLSVRHWVSGLRRSRRFEAAPTAIPASGPYRTAAKSVGSSEIEISRVALSRTDARSATTATNARHAIVQGSPRRLPPTTSPVAEAPAKAARP